MKLVPTLFLRLAVAAIAVATFALCAFALPAMWRAVPGEYPSATYVFYCILLAVYLSALPFSYALYQAWQVLSYIDKGKAFSLVSVTALKRIAYCALAISAIYAASMPFFYIWADRDDAPGLVIISMMLVAAPLTVAVFAAVLQRLFRQALGIKSENDLTV